MTLPRGWTQTTLGEVADFVMGQAPPGQDCNAVGIGTPFVKAGEFGHERPIIKEWTTKPLKTASSEDVLVCVVGATAGKINRGADCAIGRSVAAIRPGAASTADFIYARMRLEVQRLRQASTGTAQGVISREMLAQVVTKLPPLPEQRRIVAKLDALTIRIARARAEVNNVSRLVKAARTTAVESEFRHQLHVNVPNERSGNSITIEEIAGEGPINGWSPPSGADATGALTLKLTATTSGRLRLDSAAVKRIYDTPPDTSKFWLQTGDLLIQRANALEHVGATAIYEGPPKTYIYPDLMMRIRVSDPKLTRLLWYYLNSPRVRAYFRDKATGTAGNMPKISGAVVRSLTIPNLSEIERELTLERLDAAFARTDRLEAEAARAAALLDRLEASILAKAFRGELVPQDPADEPVSVLLDRIRAERAAVPKTKRGRRAAPTVSS